MLAPIQPCWDAPGKSCRPLFEYQAISQGSLGVCGMLQERPDVHILDPRSIARRQYRRQPSSPEPAPLPEEQVGCKCRKMS